LITFLGESSTCKFPLLSTFFLEILIPLIISDKLYSSQGSFIFHFDDSNLREKSSSPDD